MQEYALVDVHTHNLFQIATVAGIVLVDRQTCPTEQDVVQYFVNCINSEMVTMPSTFTVDPNVAAPLILPLPVTTRLPVTDTFPVTPRLELESTDTS